MNRLDLDTIEKRVGSTSNIKKILENLQKEYSERGINLILNLINGHSELQLIYQN